MSATKADGRAVDVNDVLKSLDRHTLIHCSIASHRQMFSIASGVIKALVMANHDLRNQLAATVMQYAVQSLTPEALGMEVSHVQPGPMPDPLTETTPIEEPVEETPWGV